MKLKDFILTKVKKLLRSILEYNEFKHFKPQVEIEGLTPVLKKEEIIKYVTSKGKEKEVKRIKKYSKNKTTIRDILLNKDLASIREQNFIRNLELSTNASKEVLDILGEAKNSR